MSYYVETAQLTSEWATSHDLVALVQSKQDIADAVKDIRAGRLKVKWILLSEDISLEYERHQAESWKKIGNSALQLAGSVLKADGLGILSSGANLFKEGPGCNLRSDGFYVLDSFCAWCRQSPIKFNGNQLGVFTTARLKWDFLLK